MKVYSYSKRGGEEIPQTSRGIKQDDDLEISHFVRDSEDVL